MQHKKDLVSFGERYRPLAISRCGYLAALTTNRRSLGWGGSRRRDEMKNDEVLRLREVADLLKVGEKTVYSMAQTGELPAFKVRGQWRFSRKDIDSWIEQQKNTTQDFGDEG